MVGKDAVVTPKRGRSFEARLIRVNEFSLSAGHLHLKRLGKKLEGKGFGSIREMTLAEPAALEVQDSVGSEAEAEGRDAR